MRMHAQKNVNTYLYASLNSAASDARAVTKGVVNGYSVDSAIVDDDAGLRFTIYNWSRFAPFVQVVFSGAQGK